MYCGCNPTALYSQEQISRALVRLLGEKPYASVSVSELCREAGVSRPTFYSLFQSMENVVLFTLARRSCQLPPESASGSTLSQLCRCYSQYICGNRELLKLLVENDVGYLLYNSIYESFLQCRDCQSVSETRRQYTANFIAGGVTGVVRQYCAAEPPLSPDDLYEILLELFGGSWF